jgi:hypothetical protein
VHVGEGTVHDGIDFQLSPALKTGRLEIRAQTSSAGVVSVCVASIGTYRQRAAGEPVGVDVVEGSRDASGSTSRTSHPGSTGNPTPLK